jgi:hypothetical protein
MSADKADLFLDDARDPLGEAAELMAAAPVRPAKGYVTVPLTWLAKVLPVVRSADQLIVLLLIYRQCLMTRSRTVAVPNRELAAFGVSRQTKYRLLAWLQSEGVATVEVANGKATRVTLLWFP